MKLEQSFTVKAPIEQVWAALVDVERVAPCLPGAEITGQSPDGGYEGTFTVKLGPATASYRGSLKMESLDEAGRVATMTAKGTDKRGQGGANASIVSTMRGEGDETVVEVMTDFTITGRLARFGRGGMIEDISKRLMRDFAQCLQDTLAHEPAAPAPEQAAVASATAGAPAEPLAAESAGAPPEPLAGEPAGAPPEPLAAESADAPPEPLAAESAGAPPEPLAAEPAAAPAEPALPGEEPAGAPRPDVTAEPPSPAPGIAAEPGPLPGDDAPAGGAPGDAGAAARGPDEADPWGALSPPAEAAVEPAGAEPPPRTGSIPPPSAAPRPAPQQAKQAKPVQGFSLLLSVFWERIKRFVAGLASRRRKK